MMMDPALEIVDSHAHLTDKRFEADLEEVIQRASDAGVVQIINAGYDLVSSEQAVKLAAGHPGVYAAVGVHPHDARICDDECKERISSLAGERKVVAVGETGLDYHYDLSPREVQRETFRWHLNLAKKTGLPVIIHDREAHGDTLEILKEESAGGYAGGVLHCFSGSREMAFQCLDMGFHVSFAGPATFNNARKLTEVIRAIPLDRLLCETDSPYLAPEPLRGRRNEPAYVVYVVRRIAEIKGIDFEELSAITTNNARRLFRLPGGVVST